MTCARCYGKFPADTMVRSIHTKLSYCADFAACDKRLGQRIHREDRERRKKATA